MIDTAMQILHGLDKGNKTIMRCRDTLTRLVTAFDFDSKETLAPVLIRPDVS